MQLSDASDSTTPWPNVVKGIKELGLNAIFFCNNCMTNVERDYLIQCWEDAKRLIIWTLGRFQMQEKTVYGTFR